MKHYLKFLAVFLFAYSFLNAQPSTLELKQSISEIEKKITAAPHSAQSALYLELAKAYYADQNQEKAFQVFLKSIEEAPVKDVPPNEEDKRLFEEALAVYLDAHAQSTRETAKTILQNYAPIVKQHPDYIQLAFLVGASSANNGQFADFFDLFYNSYLHAPHHYLAYKTKAIIHIKLFERASQPAIKNAERFLILEELSHAADIYPQDHTLYKMMVAFSPDNLKENTINSSLKKIIDSNMVIPRTDIGFYVEEAAKVKLYDQAQQLLNKQREWYQYSRMINMAQEFLDQQRKRD